MLLIVGFAMASILHPGRHQQRRRRSISVPGHAVQRPLGALVGEETAGAGRQQRVAGVDAADDDDQRQRDQGDVRAP